MSKFTRGGQKLARLPIPVHIEEFYDYGGKAVCSNHVLSIKIGKFLLTSLDSCQTVKFEHFQSDFGVLSNSCSIWFPLYKFESAHLAG